MDKIEGNKMKPILFSTPMIQAILEGRKTQTRRVIKPQPIDNTEVDGNFFEGNHKGYVKVDGHPEWQKQFVADFSPYQIGTILWVRETFSPESYYNSLTDCWDATGKIYYRASYNEKEKRYWKPSIFMPKEACRIFLKIVDVKVEKLQDISNEDIRKEGVAAFGSTTHKLNWQMVWESINGKESWESNSFVWAITFEKINKP